MRINEHVALSTPSILLVPYSEHHVAVYHEWMKDQDLQTATASEPLSLDEEYAMQKSWRTDPDKLTFIICLPLARADNPDQQPSITRVDIGVNDAPNKMIGDINLFLFKPDSEEMEEVTQALGGNCIGEVELMIARKELQQKGFGRAALLTFLDYILLKWPVLAREYAWEGLSKDPDGKPTPTPQLSFLRVKVHKSNLGSVRLFESVGFHRTVEGPNYFGEIELRWLPDLTSLRLQRGWARSVELIYELDER